jgi:predicted nucleic acid-binding Zn ribbon protein
MRKSNIQPVGEVIKELIRNFNLEEKVTEARVTAVWEKVMGQGISRYTTHVSYRNGTISIRLSSPVLRQELSYGKTKIIGLINEALEQDLVEEIIFC